MIVETPHFPEGQAFERQLARRQFRAGLWQRFFLLANIVAILALIAIFLNIINQSFGYVAVRYTIDPDTLADRPLEALDNAALVALLAEHTPNKLRVFIRDFLNQVPRGEFTTRPLRESLAGRWYPEGADDLTINDLTPDQHAEILSRNLSQGDLIGLINAEVVKPEIVTSWRLWESLTDRASIEAQHAAEYAGTELRMYSWLNMNFIGSSVSSSPTTTGLRTALLGSMWIMLITVLAAFPIGVGAAIYLEEYAAPTRFNRLIETNIRNLAGVPSIIYGMLGLAIFARALVDVTSGAVFGVTDSNGRTVLSAGLTMALLILPVIIINAQEAIRAVPPSIREASYGMGATKWQTIWRQVLPAALPGILTGVILSMSRAVGETAPLIVVGASTFIGVDPNGPFSKFTVVPIQIYQWTSRPELLYKNVAAAAIIVLLVLLIALNATAIILRQRYRKKLQG